MSFNVFTDDWLFVLAGDIVPLDPVSIEVVEHGHAGFRLTALQDLFPVVWLNPGWVETENNETMESYAQVDKTWDKFSALKMEK